MPGSNNKNTIFYKHTIIYTLLSIETDLINP